MRSFTYYLLLMSYLMSISVNAQVLSGFDANKKYPGAIEVRLDDDNPIPQYVRFSPREQMDEAAVFHWLRKTTPLDERTSFQWVRSEQDQLGMKHHRYLQYFEGIPVQAATLILHEQDGCVFAINGELFALDKPARSPGIHQQDIIELALENYPAEQYAWEVQAAHRPGPMADRPNPKLVWVAENFSFTAAAFQLAYEMQIYAVSPHLHRRIWLDAFTGRELAWEERSCNTDTPGTAQTQFSGIRPVVTFETAAGTFESRETGRGNGIATYDCNYTGDYASAFLFTDDDNVWEAANGADEGMECHYAAEQYYDLLLNEFGRNSLDDAGFELISYTRFADGFANAFWDGAVATFGSGADDSDLDRSLASVEVVSHEFTHGLTEFTAGLIYSDESGALNESFSDIFGLYLDFKVRPVLSNWIIGDESTSTGLGIRLASNPNFHEQPDTYGGDLWFDGAGVHTNSGVMNHWYYLLSEGGSGVNDLGDAYAIDGVGIDVAAQIAYRNLVYYLSPSSNYADAAFYAQIATTDLYGRCSSIWSSNANAWHAVGLGTPVSNELAADFSARQIQCELPAQVDFINLSSFSESAFWDFGDGTTSSDYAPSHIYTAAGVYDVSLIASGCEMGFDTLLRQQYIIVDPDAMACDTIIMDHSGTNTINACSGIILDPGGDGNYGNGINTTLTINSPGGLPFDLELQLAEIENGFDDLYIYDGPDALSPLIAQITGLGTPVPMNYETTGSSFTVVFTTDGSVTYAGFQLAFTSQGGELPPVAGFSLSGTDLALNEPLTITDESGNGGNVYYELGDGNTLFEANGIHSYSMPGTYTIAQYVSNCADTDTSYQQLTVREGGTLQLGTDTLCVTLLSGESLDTFINIANGGPGDLYHGWGLSTEEWVTISTTAGILASGEQINSPVAIETNDLIGGTYTTDISLQAGDENALETMVHFKLIVIGIPEVLTEPNPTDFGAVFNTLTYQQDFELLNQGTDVLMVESWNNTLSDYSFSMNPPFEVPAQSSVTVTVFLDPSGTGDLGDVLSMQTNAGPYDHQLLAVSSPAPIAGVDPTSICVTLEVGQTATETVTISNTGGSVLNYEWGSSGSVLVWMYGVDEDQEGQLILDILAEQLPDVEVNVYAGDSASELADELSNARILIMPESELGLESVYASAAPVIQSFVNSGGGLVHCYGGLGEPILTTGVFTGTLSVSSFGGQLLVLDADHPLMDGVTTPVEVLNHTQSYVFTSPNRTDVLALESSENAALSAQNYGAGKAVAIGYDYFETSPNADIILANAVRWVAASAVGGLPPWLTIDPLSGSVEAGGMDTGTLMFDATGLPADTLTANLFLISNDPAQPDILVQVKLIVVAAPQVGFSATPLTSCDGIVEFSDETINNPTTWTWDFGDGETSTEPNPTHVYTNSGLYTVSLLACNEIGCDELERPAYIQVDLDGSFCDTLVMQNNEVETLTNCTGYVTDDGGPEGNYTNNFESTVHLIPAGAEQVSIYVEDFRLEGCCDFVRIYDGPTTASPLIGSYNGTDLVAGDVITSTGNALTIHFDTDGSVVYSGFIFRYECSGVPPFAEFDFELDSECTNTVYFENESLHGESYLWDFGDGITSTEQHPVHHFSTVGNHLVSLTTTNSFGLSFRDQLVNIAAVPFELSIDMPSEGTTNSLITFSPVSNVNLVDFEWELGDGNYTNVEDALFVYLQPGTYPITLSAMDANGCIVTVSQDIVITLVDNVEGLKEGEHFAYYPNPVQDELFLNIELLSAGDLNLRILNPLGQVVRNVPLGNQRLYQGMIDVSQLPAGTYFLQLLTAEGRSIAGKVQKF